MSYAATLRATKKEPLFFRSLRGIRLALGGAILGVALASIVARYFGVNDEALVYASGALLGGVASGLLIKIVHLV